MSISVRFWCLPETVGVVKCPSCRFSYKTKISSFHDSATTTTITITSISITTDNNNTAFFCLCTARSCLPHPAPPRSRLQYLEQYTAAGLRFYLNPRTNDVRWSPPKSRRRGASRDTGAAASGGGAAVANRRGGPAGSADTSVSNTSRGGSLPHGWEMRTTPAGRPYYVNHAQRITQWTPPPPSPDSGSAAPATGAGEQKSTAAAFVQSSTSSVGFGMAPAVQHPPSAPVSFGGGGGVGEGVAAGGAGNVGLPGYIEIRTHADGRTYYVNHRTQVTSWVPPSKEDW